MPIQSIVVPPRAADSAAVERITAFHQAFDAAWRRSEAARHLIDDVWGVSSPAEYSKRETDDLIFLAGRWRRVAIPYGNARCWGANGFQWPGLDSLRTIYRHRWIVSAHNLFGVCPAWFGNRVRLTGEERLALDHALEPDERPAIRARREELLTALSTALEADPPPAFLRGYVRASTAALPFAEAEFRTALALAPADVR